MAIEELDKTIRLMELEILELKKKMNTVYQEEPLGLFSKTILIDNFWWTRVSSIPVYRDFKIISFKQYSVTEFIITEKTWLINELSTDKKKPTTVGTMYNGKIYIYIDDEGYANIMLSRSGNNLPTDIITLTT